MPPKFIDIMRPLEGGLADIPIEANGIVLRWTTAMTMPRAYAVW